MDGIWGPATWVAVALIYRDIRPIRAADQQRVAALTTPVQVIASRLVSF